MYNILEHIVRYNYFFHTSIPQQIYYFTALTMVTLTEILSHRKEINSKMSSVSARFIPLPFSPHASGLKLLYLLLCARPRLI